MSAIKVAIADDEPFVRAALRAYLSASSEFHVIGEAEDGEGALALVQATPPDVLLLDLSMPRVGGVEVLRRLKSLAPLTGVVVLSGYAAGTFEHPEGWTAAGAYLDKACPPEEILRTVRLVAQSKRPRELA